MPAKGSTSTVKLPPFPPLKWDGYSWGGTDTLRPWAGFQAREGAYGGRSSRRPSTGRVQLHVGGEAADESEPPAKSMAAAYAYLKQNEAAVRDAILDALVAYYPKLRDIYGDDEFGGDGDDDDDDFGDELRPRLPATIRGRDDLKTLIGLHAVHFLEAAKGGVGYVGFEFGCTWDDEHGLGVMTHKNRVTEIGGADVSFLEWVAEKDAKKARKKKAKKAARSAPKKAKKAVKSKPPKRRPRRP